MLLLEACWCPLFSMNRKLLRFICSSRWATGLGALALAGRVRPALIRGLVFNTPQVSPSGQDLLVPLGHLIGIPVVDEDFGVRQDVPQRADALDVPEAWVEYLHVLGIRLKTMVGLVAYRCSVHIRGGHLAWNVDGAVGVERDAIVVEAPRTPIHLSVRHPQPIVVAHQLTCRNLAFCKEALTG